MGFNSGFKVLKRKPEFVGVDLEQRRTDSCPSFKHPALLTISERLTY